MRCSGAPTASVSTSVYVGSLQTAFWTITVAGSSRSSSPCTASSCTHHPRHANSDTNNTQPLPERAEIGSGECAYRVTMSGASRSIFWPSSRRVGSWVSHGVAAEEMQTQSYPLLKHRQTTQIGIAMSNSNVRTYVRLTVRFRKTTQIGVYI